MIRRIGSLCLCLLLTALPMLGLAAADSNDTPITTEPLTLRWWRNLDAKSMQVLTDWSENEGFQQIQANTGITLEFITPPVGQETESFNLMVAARDLPDIIEYGWRTYAGGPQKAIDDRVILDLTEPIAQYGHYYPQVVAENPELAVGWRTADGKDYMFGFARSKIGALYYGYQIRMDWLEKLGLSVPSTIPEWYDVLVAFRDQDPNGNGEKDEIPFGHIKNWGGVYAFALGFGVGATNYDNGFYVEDGTVVKYAPLEPGFKEYITTMAQWYAEGLIDPEYAALDMKGFESKVYNDLIGAQYGGLGTGFMGKHNLTMIEQNDRPDFLLQGILPPKDAAGVSRAMYDHDAPGHGVAIGANCQSVEQAVRLLDYCYGPEGSFLINFGPEGKAAVMTEDGPQYTDLVLNSPDGNPYDVATLKYGMITTSGPFLQHEIHPKTSMAYFGAFDTAEAIAANCNLSWRLPPVPLSAEAAVTINDVMADVKTYVDEMVDMFIMGTMPLSEYDGFVQTVRDMGVESALALYQSHLDQIYAN